ncbi:uncharacterized protein J3D65DRAFT_697811 [Phyllosticta citribraziliensis]|uniref:Transmembrane protein n=1 Tax=Phyllosticta citribraziliensis TaxID=989973 RepID=A0ABR1LMG9_9PEZI
MAPLFKLLLHAPLLLGVSLAQQPQNRPALTYTMPTPGPQATGGIWNMILGPGAFPKMVSPWDGRNLTEGNPVKLDLKSSPKQRKPSTTSPIFWPTVCPPKTFSFGDFFPENTKSSYKTHHRGICQTTCMRQYLTPVVSTVSGYKGSNCKQVTKVVTYTESPHWGDAHGRLIPKGLFYSLAGLNTTATNTPQHCKKTKGRKRPSRTIGKSSKPTSSSKKGKKNTPPPVPECTSFESCYRRCEMTTRREKKVTYALLLLLGGFAGAVVAFVIIRKAYRNRRIVRRREASGGESGPPPTFHDPPVTEEVVEVVEVEPRPEEKTVVPVEKTAVEKVPAVIVERPTPTSRRSVVADGASDNVDERDPGARLRVPRATGSGSPIQSVVRG